MKIISILKFILLSFIGILFLGISGYSLEEWEILLCVIFMILIYFNAIHSISKDNKSSMLADGRFYFWSFITLYSIWVPMLAIFSSIIDTPFASLDIYGAVKYSIPDLLLTCYTSILLMLGMRIGLFFALRFKRHANIDNYNNTYTASRKYKLWFFISIISTFVFLTPFIMGGFTLLKAGGTILDVESISIIFSGNILMTMISFFFSSEVMTISTSIFIMYYLESKNNPKRKAGVLLLVLIFHAVLSVLTTRSARFMIILIVSFSLIVNNRELRNHRIFKRLAVIVPIFMMFVYFIDYIIVDQVRSNFSLANEDLIVEIMRRFDGIGPYDALFKAVHYEPDFAMLSNVLYSFFRPIPIFGQFIIDLFGLDLSASPLYLWMSIQYPNIYSAGGGLAYMPQIEAYLVAGFFWCLVFGILYGLMFGIRRHRVKNIIVIAMSLMLARGSLGIIASLSIPYVFICYFLYEKIITNISFSKIRKKEFAYEKE